MARPDLSYLRNAALSFSGLFCGALTGATVAAGSVVSAPMVRFLLGLRPGRAGSTALAMTSCAAFGAIINYDRHHVVHWGDGIILAATQIIGVALAERRAVVLRTLPALRVIWSLLAMAGGLAMAKYSLSIAHPSRMGLIVQVLHSPVAMLAWVAVVGIVVGALSQVMELGGVLVIPACLLLLHLTPVAAQGTALAGLLFVSIAGFLIYIPRGEVDARSAGWMSFGGWFGGLIGATIAFRLSSSTLVLVYGIALSAMGLARFFVATGNRPPADAGAAL